MFRSVDCAISIVCCKHRILAQEFRLRSGEAAVANMHVDEGLCCRWMSFSVAALESTYRELQGSFNVA